MMRRILFVIVFILLCPAASWAAGYCGAWGSTEGGSTPWTVSSDAEGTASVAYADVNACAGVATYGDTINIPAGTAKWASTLILTKDVIIKGAGYGSTVIQADYNAATNSNCYPDGSYAAGACFFKFAPDETAVSNIDALDDSGTFEISDLTLEILSYTPGTRSIGIYIVESVPIRRVKIHDVRFDDVFNAVFLRGPIYGVIYNSIFNGCSVMRCGARNYTSWSAYQYTPGGADAWYIEDNTISESGASDFFVYTGHGGAFVARYNTFNPWTYLQIFDWHGNQTEIAATQGVEIYGNLFNLLSGGGNYLYGRGGQAKVFYNYRGSGTRTLNAVVYEEYPNGCVLHPALPEGVGVNYIDETTYALDGDWDNGNYSVVVRAAGGGIGQKTKITSISGTRITVADTFDPAIDTSTYYSIVNDTWYDAYDQEVTNTYYWQNRNGETAMNVKITTSTAWWFNGLAEDTNFFVEKSDFNGTSGVGCGAIGDRPLTCTTGTAYWATDQGNCSDLTGYVGANATEIVGTLYKCTSKDTWTSYYTPYAYPHPLRDESTPDFTVTVTNTGSGHSPSHDGARSVQTGGSLTFTSGVYNGWKVAIAGTCGCTTDGCTVTPTENCTITCTSSEIQLMPW